MLEQTSDQAAPALGDIPARAPRISAPLAAYELRPLSTGEILDRTFTMYRRNFWLYCGLSVPAAALAVLVSLIQFALIGTPNQKAMDAQAAVGIMIGLLASLVATFFYLAAYSLTQAATVSAVLATYLGDATSFRQAMKTVGAKWWRYIAIIFWQGWSATWVFLLLFFPSVVMLALPALRILGVLLMLGAFASLIYGVIAYIRNSLAIPASVMEKLDVRRSMRRSKTLVAGDKGRIFLLLLLLLALGIVVGVVQAPFAMAIQLHPAGKHFVAQGLSLLIQFVSSSLVGPVGAIGFCLFYIDERVRKEGFDIEALMDRTLGTDRPKPEPAITSLLPSGFAPSGFTAESAAAPMPPPFPSALSSPFAPSEFTAGLASPSPAPAPPPGAAHFPPSGFTAGAAEDRQNPSPNPAPEPS